MLAKSKSNSIETLISQAIIDLEIIHEEFKTIVNEEENYRKLKENIRMMKIQKKVKQLKQKNYKRK